MDWFGLGKRRSKLGEFIDKHDLTQQEVADKSGVSRGTISRLCQSDGFQPKIKNAAKIVRALKELTKKDVRFDDFWDM
ncbi:helix-turn-helix transcriptional regulator [Bacillus sp. FJAT-47783]|uniref:helix-turn-helix transcriptional regulator n=1 Tax=Bacillus sp. FJAT-47783 TaxID=2922712 RepID=UPI001FAC250D|nr:helix-turn-helix transcriptional regulator [Bacillus sp. FJAT-47783]